ncbi:hypothetical protein CTU88_46580 [Streptomyces sp. JV178]|uniref:hypothetical protein n=1 Tax=Streptomyces sp. JV178 TaxID=858632 RepID=UPI000C1B5727|nr:hypothetical protein [Streptomyces sp. JV178]PIM65876.1 hypothetical protein CTU88_46580 [Streptomyces sp. JV178]
MALGFEVSKQVLDTKAAQAVLGLREAFDVVETIAEWLANHPVIDAVDPLTTEPFGYSADEAYALRFYFGTFNGVKNANTNAFNAGRKMTGLE